MKKIEEERRKLKRDKLLLDKATREARSPSSNCSNCQENKVRTQRILSELNTKERKWNAAINKLKEKLSRLEEEKKMLETDHNKSGRD